MIIHISICVFPAVVCVIINIGANCMTINWRDCLNNDLFISRRILTKKNKVGNKNADGNGVGKS